MKTKFSDELRAAIVAAEKSRYQIRAETGIDEATLSRFIHGKGGLSIDGLDAIAECLGLHVSTKPAKRKTKRTEE